ncbi:hypothetical protein SAMN05444920_103870 [Nonomuraea solani]|uniref:Uncharacterized protein n=2 Tax=Nonomuraea solani TaxID=1144553 RepID=A0A1H6C380_9ACTN|nr:hypothetical protein SAMN05444920_103870 [Nonomuraea solani]
MPKKDTRLITVDGTTFRWRVSHRPAYRKGDDRAPLRFVVERAEEPGGVLQVSLPCARPDNWVGERTIVVRPVLVAGCVRRAIEQGWDAGRPGPAFTLSIAEDDLTPLLGEAPEYLVPFLWGMIPEGGGIKDLPRATQIWPRQAEH